MNNHSNEENTDNSSDKKKSLAFKVLESNAEKFLMVWWYGALAKAERRNTQPKVHVAFRELLEDYTPTDNFIFIDANITDLVSWPIGTVWHHELIYAELSGDFPLGDSRQPTYKSLRPFDLVS